MKNKSSDVFPALPSFTEEFEQIRQPDPVETENDVPKGMRAAIMNLAVEYTNLRMFHPKKAAFEAEFKQAVATHTELIDRSLRAAIVNFLRR